MLLIYLSSYALLGFKTVKGFEYPEELEERRISNPDAFEYLHTLTVQSGSESVDVLPVIQSLLPLNEAIQLPDFFAALDIVLLAVDTRTGQALRDGNGELNADGVAVRWCPAAGKSRRHYYQ